VIASSAWRDPGFPGYDTYLDDRMKAVLPTCLRRGTRIFSNQGWIPREAGLFSYRSQSVSRQSAAGDDRLAAARHAAGRRRSAFLSLIA